MMIQKEATEAARTIANLYAMTYMSVQGNAGCWGEKHVIDLAQIIQTALNKSREKDFAWIRKLFTA